MTTGSIDLSDAGQNRVTEVKSAAGVHILNERVAWSAERIDTTGVAVDSNHCTRSFCHRAGNTRSITEGVKAICGPGK